jgi:hypothetical protein
VSEPVLTRDDWMVVSRALQDRIDALGRQGGHLCGLEVEHCRRLETMISAHVDHTWIDPKGAAA